FAAHFLDQLVIVPWVLGFLRRLHLHDVHFMHHHAVGADVAALGEHVVDFHFLQLGHYLVGVGGFDGIHRLQVVHGGRVVGGLIHGWLLFHLVEEALSKCPGIVVH